MFQKIFDTPLTDVDTVGECVPVDNLNSLMWVRSTFIRTSWFEDSCVVSDFVWWSPRFSEDHDGSDQKNDHLDDEHANENELEDLAVLVHWLMSTVLDSLWVSIATVSVEDGNLTELQLQLKTSIEQVHS